MQQSKSTVIYVTVSVIAFLFAGFVLLQARQTTSSNPSLQLPAIGNKQTLSPTLSNATYTGTAKGAVGISNPKPGQMISSPLIVTGVVYVKKGTLTITLKQKETGAVVTQPKVVQISGQSDKITFAEAIQFGLPVKPQKGILEINFKDQTGKNADDKVSVEVEFPSDLGRG